MYREDEAPVSDGTPEVGGPGADGAVPERLRRRRHARESAPPELLQSPDHATLFISSSLAAESRFQHQQATQHEIERRERPLSYGTTAKATAAAAAAVGEADAVDERDLGSEGIGDLEVGWLEKWRKNMKLGGVGIWEQIHSKEKWISRMGHGLMDSTPNSHELFFFLKIYSGVLTRH